MNQELENTTCEVRFDAISREIYSIDASIYEIKPLGVILPKNRSDLIAAVKAAYNNGYSITARGAATGITGGCLGSGIVIDTAKYLSHILEIDLETKTATVEPGVIQDQLNLSLFPHGFRLGPDTSTGDRATLGGMAANNAAGARSLLYGKMSDAVLEIEMILADGQAILFKEESEESWRIKCQLPTKEGEIYRSLDAIRHKYKEAIANHFPKIPRLASGYNLPELIKPFPINSAKVLVGSEGTLGIFSKLKVKIDLLPGPTALHIFSYSSILEAMQAVESILAFSPIALELIDENIISAGKRSPSMRGKLDWLQGNPQALLVAEFPATQMFAENAIILKDPVGMAHVWALRKAGLGLLLSKRSYSRAVAFIEDLSIPPTKLASFMEKFLQILGRYNKTAGIYGHAGSGCLHIRPYMDLRDAAECKLAEEIMITIADLVLEMNGALSGEHGDGLIRSWLNEKMFGKEIYEAFLKLKQVFDPLNRMNPGKIVNGQTFAENLRPAPQIHVDTFFSFAKEGGLVLSADLCNGNGQCRKEKGIMCPSFQVTKDEYDTTRARANVLRGIFNKTIPNSDLASQELHDILDLCIQCKGCKTECPSQVDMAKMKAEALFHYHQTNGYSLRSKLFAHLPVFFKWGSIFPWLFNAFGKLSFFKKITGIAEERKLPIVTKPFFFTSSNTPDVILFVDTYTQFISPQIGLAAIQVLQSLGYHVKAIPWQCCGRTLLSKGYLIEAKKKAKELIDHLIPYAAKNIPIIGIEPSCLLSFKDEYLDFFPESSILASNSFLFDAFLAKKSHKMHSKKAIEVYVHTHCHQKAIIGSKATLEVLRSISNVKASEINSGCCGMAGSFGYESEHYDFSTKIANLSLLPAIHAMPEHALLVANGFSCRSQIEDLSGKKVYHLAELLKDIL